MFIWMHRQMCIKSVLTEACWSEQNRCPQYLNGRRCEGNRGGRGLWEEVGGASARRRLWHTLKVKAVIVHSKNAMRSWGKFNWTTLGGGTGGPHTHTHKHTNAHVHAHTHTLFPPPLLDKPAPRLCRSGGCGPCADPRPRTR